MKKKECLLIVGGTGFIGYHLAKKCIKNFKVLSVSKKKPNRSRKKKIFTN